MGGGVDPIQFITTLLVLFLGVGLHEYSHAKFADLAGDPTPRYFGRVTLNLFKHFEPAGTIMMLITAYTGYGIGWGRPCPMDPRKMRNPRWDHFIAVLAGPVSNVAQAVVYGLLLRVFALGLGQWFAMFLILGVVINLSLAIFNLIPLGPLDGHWLLGLLMPEDIRYKWFLFNRKQGSFLLLGLIIFSQVSGNSLLSQIFGPPVEFGFRLITGHALG